MMVVMTMVHMNLHLSQKLPAWQFSVKSCHPKFTPVNSIEERTQALAFESMNCLHESYAAFEMFAKMRMRFMVLALWTMANAVGKDGFQCVEVVSREVDALIGYQSGEMLADALAHEARFAVI